MTKPQFALVLVKGWWIIESKQQMEFASYLSFYGVFYVTGKSELVVVDTAVNRQRFINILRQNFLCVVAVFEGILIMVAMLCLLLHWSPAIFWKVRRFISWSGPFGRNLYLNPI